MNRTLRGLGIRTIVLVIGIVVVGIWLVSLAMKIAGAAIHFFLIVGLVLIVAAALGYVVHRFKRRT